MADVVFACQRDWANVGWVFQESLRAVGVDAVALRTGKSHPFGYPEQARRVDIVEMQAEVDKGFGVMFMHSQWPGELVLKDKKVAVFHGGSWYRNEPERWNVFWNPKIRVSAIQTANLLDLGAKNVVWVMPSVDTDAIVPNGWFQSGKLRFAHFPRKASKKGSAKFVRAMMAFEGKGASFQFDPVVVPWKKSIERMSNCDVYLESQEYERKGPNGLKPIGVWGITAMEVAALGKIVVTCFAQKKRYEREFGECPIIGANSKEELNKVIRKLLELSSSEIVQLQKKHREWVVRCHSRQAVGSKLLAKVFY